MVMFSDCIWLKAQRAAGSVREYILESLGNGVKYALHRVARPVLFIRQPDFDLQEIFTSFCDAHYYVSADKFNRFIEINF